MGSRVVITGLGPVTSIGIGSQQFNESLYLGRSGVHKATTATVQDFPVKHAGEVTQFDHQAFSRDAPMGRCAAMAMRGTQLAIEDANLTSSPDWPDHAAVCIGTTDGEAFDTDLMLSAWISSGVENMDSALVRRALAESLAPTLARQLKVRFAGSAIATACAAGNYALGYAFDLLSLGEVSVVIAGGAEAIARKSFAGFHRLGAIAQEKCQPFSVDRTGMIPAEAAGVVVMETLEHARARGARIYAEVLGYGLSCDAKHPTSPDAESIATCIRRAHRRAGIEARQVDYICAHGTGTRINDIVEAAAIRAVFEDTRPYVTSIKSILGHTMGAASALGVISSVLSITHDYIPATINCRALDVECDINCVMNEALPMKVNIVQNHGFAFGGNNAVMILGRID